MLQSRPYYNINSIIYIILYYFNRITFPVRKPPLKSVHIKTIASYSLVNNPIIVRNNRNNI